LGTLVLKGVLTKGIHGNVGYWQIVLQKYFEHFGEKY